MKNTNLSKLIFILGLGIGMSTLANANANGNSCNQLERLCKMGSVSACNVYVRTCR